MIYIASPYSHVLRTRREERFYKVLEYTNRLIQQDKIAFSAIVYGHPFADRLHAPINFEYWRSLNHHMIFVASEVHVLMLEGWDISKGVADEIAYAEEIGKPITYVNWK